jgi:hypothetical protein
MACDAGLQQLLKLLLICTSRGQGKETASVASRLLRQVRAIVVPGSPPGTELCGTWPV